MTQLASRIFIAGDPAPVWVDLAPDLVVTRLEEALDEVAHFVRFDGMPTSCERAAPVYVQPHAVTCVLALTAAQIARCEEDAC